MRAIIIAGGFGTRLRPLTFNVPKVMVSVGNIPFVHHQISLLKKYGIKEIILNLHYLSDSIKELLKDEEKHGVKIYYSMEESPLGTAGAVKNAEQFFTDEPLLIFNGDILTDINLKELVDFHKKNKAKATLTLTRVEDPTTYGLIITDENGRIKEFIEKPSWERVTTNTVNAGIYVIDPKVFNKIPKGVAYSFERELFPNLLNSGEPVFGFDSDAYWLDIGNPSKYMQAHRAILEQEVAVEIPGNEISKRIWVGESTNISKESKVFGPAIIGNKCEIAADVKIDAFTVLGDKVIVGKNSIISNSIILSGSIIRKDVVLKNCIIGNNCQIEDSVEIGGGVILADNTTLQKGSKLGIKL